MAAFSKRHYIAIADTIADLQTDQTLFTRSELARLVVALVKRFTADNQAFDADRFVVACGFPSVQIAGLLVTPGRKRTPIRKVRGTDNAD